jgi:peptide/nickel transport system ATP-binding protein
MAQETQDIMAQNGAGEVVLRVCELTVSLPENMDRTHAVEGISFDLRRGEILCIVGESGSGKSVTANAIMGLLPPRMAVRGGRIALQGRDLLSRSEMDLRAMRGRFVSIVFQDSLSALNPLMPVGAQIVEVMALHKSGTARARQQKCLALLREVGLPTPERISRQYPFHLSGGQRQRVMIAMALALEPDILIADEPTTALDVTTQAQILALIRRLQQSKNMSVMFITHDFGVVAEIADRIMVMEKGRLVEQGRAETVLLAPVQPYTRRLLASVPHLADAAPANGPAGAPIMRVRNLRKTYKSGGRAKRWR